MNKQRIQQLVRLMPGNTGHRMPGLWRPKIKRIAECIAVAESDPAFGYKFIQEVIRQGKPLPPGVNQSFLRRGFNHYAGVNVTDDLVMVEIESLTLAANGFVRAVLQALLICKDVTIADIAKQLSLSTEVVQVYEQLHFNVRDRWEEKAYIASLVYPHGRVQLLKTDAADELTFAEQLLQAGYMFGAKEVLVLAGMDISSGLPSVAQSRRKLEEGFLANAVQLMHSGHLNSTKSPGLTRATALLAAMREVDPPSHAEDDSKAGLGALNIGPGDAILMTMHGLTGDPFPDLAEIKKQNAAAANQEKS